MLDITVTNPEQGYFFFSVTENQLSWARTQRKQVALTVYLPIYRGGKLEDEGGIYSLNKVK